MSTLSKETIQHFINVCHWTYETWITYRIVFDDNPHKEQLARSEYGPFFERLREITADYALLQLAKLHDRDARALGLPYIMNKGGWEGEAANRLRQLYTQLDAFYQQIKPARNKILAHSELATIVNNQPQGAFPKDADLEYFHALEQFISIVRGGPFQFGAFPGNDARIFVDGLHRLLKPRRR